MKRFIVSLTVGLCASLAAHSGLSAAEIPDARSSEGPALVALGDRVVFAWANAAGIQEHSVWYAEREGDSAAPVELAGALTTTAPALAAAGGRVYLATTPPRSNDRIYYYVSRPAVATAAAAQPALSFEPSALPLCDGEVCAHTRAAPALIGDGDMLYAAWSTPDGEIRYAEYSNNAWRIATMPISNALTSPSTGPALTLFDHRLQVAWVTTSGESVSVVSAPLPLSSPEWSTATHFPAHTKVAPALRAFYVEESTPGAAAEFAETLFLAWATADGDLDFARWSAANQAWVRAPSPVPVPPGPLTLDSPALGSSIAVLPDDECIFSSLVAYTGVGNGSGGSPVYDVLGQSTHPCPSNIHSPPGP